MRLFCALLLVLIGFAHKPVQTFASTNAPGVIYTLPDGSIADICYGDYDDGAKKHVVDRGCDACRLAASILLPMVDVEASAPRPDLQSTILGWDEAFHRLLQPPSASPRGPPARSDLV